MREESIVRWALAAKQQNVTKYKNFDGSWSNSKSTNAKGNWKKSYPLASTAQRKVILHLNVGEDLMLSAMSVIKWCMKLLFAKIRINHMVKLQGLLIKKRKSTSLLLYVFLALNKVKIDLSTMVVLTTWQTTKIYSRTQIYHAHWRLELEMTSALLWVKKEL